MVRTKLDRYQQDDPKVGPVEVSSICRFFLLFLAKWQNESHAGVRNKRRSTTGIRYYCPTGSNLMGVIGAKATVVEAQQATRMNARIPSWWGVGLWIYCIVVEMYQLL
jgi:hypothetical protein